MATALRYGIILDCRVVEYQEPEVWVAQNADELHQTPPTTQLCFLWIVTHFAFRRS